MLTMAPPPARCRAGTACFIPRKTPLAFTFMRVSHAAVLVVSGSNVPLIPALLTRTSSLPKLATRSEEHTSELQSRLHLVCRLLLEKKKNIHKDAKHNMRVHTQA